LDLREALIIGLNRKVKDANRFQRLINKEKVEGL